MLWLLLALFLHIAISSLLGTLITYLYIISSCKNTSSINTNVNTSRDSGGYYKTKDSINGSEYETMSNDNSAHSVFDTIICLISIVLYGVSLSYCAYYIYNNDVIIDVTDNKYYTRSPFSLLVVSISWLILRAPIILIPSLKNAVIYQERSLYGFDSCPTFLWSIRRKLAVLEVISIWALVIIVIIMAFFSNNSNNNNNFSVTDIRDVLLILSCMGSLILTVICNVYWTDSYYLLSWTVKFLNSCWNYIAVYFCFCCNRNYNTHFYLDNYEEEEERNVSNSILNTWFTHVLTIGAFRTLEFTDLPALPFNLTCQMSTLRMQHCNSILQKENNKNNEANSRHDDWLHDNNDSDRKSLYSMKTLIMSIYGMSFLVLGIIKAALTVVSFGGPLLLGQLVRYVEKDDDDKNIGVGLGWCSLFFIGYCMIATLNTQYNIRGMVLALRMKGALTRILFSRAISLPSCAWADLQFTDSQLITLIQVDVEKVSDTFKGLHDLWILPLQVCITFVLLYQEVDVAFLAGVAIIIIMIPLNTIVAKKIGIASKELMTHKDKRIQIISEAIRSIRSVKMLGLEHAILGLQKGHRDNEFKYLKQRKYLDAICVFLWATMPVVVPFVTFTTTVLLGRSLTASSVFTTIALLNMLIFPMNAFPWVVNGAMEALVSIRRITKVLSNDNHEIVAGSYDTRSISRSSDQSQSFDIGAYSDVEDAHDNQPSYVKGCASTLDYIDTRDSPLIVIDKASFVVGTNNKTLLESPDLSETPSFTVNNISLHAYKGQIIGITGSVASGKSVLLLGLLNEIMIKSGQIRLKQLPLPPTTSMLHTMADAATVSYCPQIPLLHSGTIRENIIMGSEFDEVRYADVLQGCGLDLDIETGHWPLGDLTRVGNGGSTLSGGQRLRIAVAKAIYSLAPVVLLDDPFSALDNNTAQSLMDYLTALMKREQRVLILVTHSVYCLAKTNQIIILEKGNEVLRGSFKDLVDRPQFNAVISKDIANKIMAHDSEDIKVTDTVDDSNNVTTKDNDDNDNDSGDKLENKEKGRIALSVYKSYLSASGIWLSVLVILFTFLMQVCANGIALWYSIWSSNPSAYSDTTFLYISSLIMVANLFMAFFRSILFAYTGLKAAYVLYDDLASSVFMTSLSLFEGFSVTIGQLLNRFGKDTNSIDDSLPFQINIVLAQFFVLLGSFVLISYSDPIVLVILIVIFYLYFRLQKFYRCSSRELRRLDSIYRSPLYNLISESISNGITLRSLSATEFFTKDVEVKLNDSMRVTLSLNIASQWLNIRLQLLGILISSFIAFSSIISSTLGILPISPGLLGLSLTYSLSIVNNLNGLVGSMTETEQEMISVERVVEYIGLENEFTDKVTDSNSSASSKTSELYKPLLGDDNDDIESNTNIEIDDSLYKDASGWPIGSDIVISHVYMKYNKDSPYILKDLNLIIQPGFRAAVVGRTGQGKSTLIRILLRLNDYEGSIKLGSCELKTLSRKLVRKSICCIPQDPVIFTGSLRFNLDPSNEYTDDEIMEAVTLSSFLETFHNRSSLSSSSSSDDILSYMLVEAGGKLSQGQKQLLSLARALLHRSKIILMDEVTSSIDSVSEALLFKVLHNHISRNPDAVLIIISHKLDAIKSLCNKVIRFNDDNISLEDL